MAELKVSRTKDGVLLSGSMPAELAAASSIEIIPLRDGSFLVTPKTVQKVSNLLNEKEKGVVRKLLSVRFDQRTPQQISGILSREEKETLESLMKRKIVHLFKEGKYSKEGVYSVSDFAFHQAREEKMGEGNQVHQAGRQMPSQSPPPISSPEHLEKLGWMVLETEQEAKNFSNSFPEKVRSGAVHGVRAFDRKYYFVTSQFVLLWEKKISALLTKSEKTAEEIASELALSPEGCSCLLFHLCENGDVLEKHKGKFAKA